MRLSIYAKLLLGEDAFTVREGYFPIISADIVLNYTKQVKIETNFDYAFNCYPFGYLNFQYL